MSAGRAWVLGSEGLMYRAWASFEYLNAGCIVFFEQGRSELGAVKGSSKGPHHFVVLTWADPL